MFTKFIPKMIRIKSFLKLIRVYQMEVIEMSLQSLIFLKLRNPKNFIKPKQTLSIRLRFKRGNAQKNVHACT
jgi:hypothetical protein